jgi:HTH-type transcriptional regulator, transcriptional repressor of NAD biosynthesis genes
MSHALLVGKFLPVHRGHMSLFDAARSRCERTTIVLERRWDDPIPWDVRWRWLVESCPWARVVVPELALPPRSGASRESAASWLAALQELAPDVSHVFSGDPDRLGLATALDAEYVLIDRSSDDIRGARIRENPWQHWDLLAPAARPWFIRTVALVGGESVGKSTLSEQLAHAYDTSWVDEYGRTYTTGVPNHQWTELDAILVTDGQQVLIREAQRRARGLCVSDTEAIVTAIWTEWLRQPVPAHVWEVAARQPIDLYLLCEPDLAWVADGVRVMQSDRDWFHDRLIFHLNRLGKPWARISGSGPSRLASASHAIEEACIQWWRDLRAFESSAPGSGVGL